MGNGYMLSVDEVRNWVEQGGTWCPFCKGQQLAYVGTKRSVNGLTTVEYSCVSCRLKHFALYKGDKLVDLTHDQVSFNKRLD